MPDKTEVRWPILVLLVWSPRSAPCRPAAQPRVALVIGVSAYRAVPALPNPVNDARDLAAALGRLGFETETLLDPIARPWKRRSGASAPAHVGGCGAVLLRRPRAGSERAETGSCPPRRHRERRDLRFEALDADTVLEQVESAARGDHRAARRLPGQSVPHAPRQRKPAVGSAQASRRCGRRSAR
jgi:uncharacterized caspase-like protein